MKLIRNYAIKVYETLNTMALGHLDDATLELTLQNLSVLGKAYDDFLALKKELFKRIYGDVEQMSEDDKKNLQDFFDMLGKVKDAETESAVKAAYPALYEKREKEVKVIVSLLNKEIEVEIEPMDANAFVKGIVKGKKDTKIADIRALFALIFKAEEKKDADLSELDELM